jgi:hypothetical protein
MLDRDSKAMCEIVANNLAMRKNFTLLMLVFMCKSGIAQISSGDRIVKTYFDLGFATQTTTLHSPTTPAQEATYRMGNASLGASFGKLSNSNTAVLYGLGISFSGGKNIHGSDDASARMIGVTPSVTLQKFYQITPGIYYVPDASLGVTYQRGKTKNSSFSAEEKTNVLGVTGAITPFAVGINLKKSMMLTLSAGRMGIEYSHRESKYKSSGQEAVTNSFSVFANSNSWAVGLIFNLNKKS